MRRQQQQPKTPITAEEYTHLHGSDYTAYTLPPSGASTYPISDYRRRARLDEEHARISMKLSRTAILRYAQPTCLKGLLPDCVDQKGINPIAEDVGAACRIHSVVSQPDRDCLHHNLNS